MIKIVSLSLFTCLLLVASLFAQQSLPELDQHYAEFAEAEALLDQPIEAWNTAYREKLLALEKHLQEAGKLDELLAVKEEMNQPGVVPAARNFTLLRRTQSIYFQKMQPLQAARVAGLEKAQAAYRTKLLALQKKLTRNGRIEDALKVRGELENLGENRNSEAPISNGKPTPRLSDGLMAYWKFDGNGQDASANGVHGNVSGNDLYGSGVYGQALQLGDGQQAMIPAHAAVKMQNPMTLAFWLKLDPEARPSGWPFIMGSVGRSDALRVHLRESRPGQLHFSPDAPHFNSREKTLNDGKWHQVTIVLEPRKMSYFIDGFRSLTKTNDDQDFTVRDGGGGFAIGVNPNGPAGLAKGAIDEVRLYNRALEASEIKRLGALHLAKLPPASRKPWQDLLEIKYAEAEGGEWFLRFLNVKGVTGATQGGGRKLKSNLPSDALVCHPNGRIKYTFSQPITEFRGVARAFESTSGNGFLLEILSGGRPVYVSDVLSANAEESVAIRFPPTRELILVSYDLGNVGYDHALWIKPEVR